MMKHLFYALLLGAGALGFTACGGDDETPVPNNTAQDEQSSQGGSNDQNNNGQEGNGQGNVTTPEIVVNVDENGNADGGHSFVKENDATFYIDDVKYKVLNNGNLQVTGLVQNSTRPEITIVSQLNYGGKQMKVTSIGYGAFNSCTSLNSITLPNSLNTIGENAFYGCSGLTSIFIPKNVTSIGGTPFSHCSNLSSIIVEEGNTRYDSRDGCNAIIETQYNELHCGCKNTVIPNSVKRMAKRAFQGCTGLTSITIPESMKGISQGAFSDCTGLTSITFHNSFVGIGENAFNGCI